MMRIDAHNHFWKYSAEQYPWMGADWPIRKDCLPNDLAPLLDSVGLDGSIAVQVNPDAKENAFMLGLADQHARVLGVVGWVDLCHPRVDKELAAFAQHPKAVGIRHTVQLEPDDNFMLRTDFQRGIGLLAQHNLVYDFLILEKQLPATVALAEKFPQLSFVINHMAKPLIKERSLSPWREQLQRLAAMPHVSCKLSGLMTEATWHGWTAEEFTPYLDVVFEAFGPERCLFGSDWPVALLAGSYQQGYQLINNYVPKHHHEAVFGGNAQRIYGITCLKTV
jgi:L-fuconolactonase